MPSFTPTPFTPAAGLRSPHAQTLFAHIARPALRPPLRRERWELPDGDFVDVDLLDAPRDRPHVLVLHGLEGSSQAGYVSAVLRGAAAQGWGAAALNFRSCSGVPNRLARSYHSGETGDALWALDNLRAKGITGPLVGVGFSLGGNVLLRLLGETGERCPLVAAAAVSTPYDLALCARSLDTGGGLMRVYRENFLWTLKRKALEKAKVHPGKLDPERIRSVRGIIGFDDAVTAPIHGFASAMAYYEACSSGPLLTQIQRPTLLLTAADDPMVPVSSLPRTAKDNPHLTLVLTDHGGHVGFVGGSVRRPRFWADEQVIAFLARQLS